MSYCPHCGEGDNYTACRRCGDDVCLECCPKIKGEPVCEDCYNEWLKEGRTT